MAKSNQTQFTVTLGSRPLGNWATFSGGAASVPIERDYDGPGAKPDVMKGRVEYENVTIGRTYDPLRDAAIAREMRELLDSDFEDTVTVQSSNQRGEPLAVAPRVYLVTVAKVTEPEVDANGSARATFSLEFAVLSQA